MKNLILIVSAVVIGHYVDMPLWQLSLCLALAGWSLNQISKVKGGWLNDE